MKTFRSLGSVLGLSAVAALSQTPSLPRISIQVMIYEGAFRVPADKYGLSEMNFSAGPVAYNPKRHSVYLVGRTYQ